MTHMHILGCVVLIGIFVIGTLRPVPLGALGLVAAFLVGTVAIGETVPEILAGFPVNLLILIVGVTYLFSIARANGTLELVADRMVQRVGSSRYMALWMLFLLSFVPTALGSPASVAMVAPIAVNVASR